jgi:hypothetical protein
MGKKKASKKKAKAATKATTKATASKRAKQPAIPPKKSAARSKAKAKPKAKPSKAPPPPSLGRPKVTAEEKLFMLFKEDYHARQIFEFLRAETVRDLETWSPDEIVKQLSLPIKQSVDRIRRKLAEYHRSLRDDQEFALKHRPSEPTESTAEKPTP